MSLRPGVPGAWGATAFVVVAAVGLVASPVALGADPYEPNDSIGTAYGPTADGTYAAEINPVRASLDPSETINQSSDQDYYKIVVDQAGETLTLTNTDDYAGPGDSNVDANLQDSAGQLIGLDAPTETGSDATFPSSNSSSLTIYDPGTYYLYVSGSSPIDASGNGPLVPYHFTITRSTNGGSPPPGPPPGSYLKAHCDVYTAAPGSTLRVPAARGVLANDHGLGLRAHVVRRSFGVSSHRSKLNARTGALRLGVGRRAGLRTLELAYYDTDSAGNQSNIALATVVVSKRKLSRSRLRRYCVTEGSTTTFRSLTRHCTRTRLTTHHLHITARGVHGTLSWAARAPGNTKNVCLHLGILKNGWTLHGVATVKWKGKPKVPDEIGIEDDISISGYDITPSVGLGSGGPGISVDVSSASQRAQQADKRSHSTHDSIDFNNHPVKVSAVDSRKLTQTVTPYIALPGYHHDATVDPLRGRSPAAHVCAKTDLDVIVRLGRC